MTAPQGMSGEAWLAAAIGGGLPEPARTRWQPMRVGIISLWEYDDAEFWFADGRLVLRGGNGAGKTKVLELTTLMLLRGEITPSVLDPFGSQHRTMRFNLIPTEEADDPREPADSGLGYAWVEFGRLDETGQPVYFVCGMGVSARRGTGTGGVATWHFVTTRRPGKDFMLIVGGRAVEQRELKKLDGVTVPPSAGAYRARLAGDLFGVAEDSYGHLLDLLKQLRKPKLGERLNPASLAETLRDALPPLATNEITQLAEGWDHLDQLRRAVEQTERAAAAVARFVRAGWRPWARVVLRRRADTFASATTTLDNTTRDKRGAEDTLRQAEQGVRDAEEQLLGTKQHKQDRDTELRELLDSQSYQDAVAAAGRVESLRREVDGLDGQLTSAQRRLTDAAESVERATGEATEARTQTGTAEGRARTASAELAGVAEAAGLRESTHRHLPARDVDALTADHDARTERFAELRLRHNTHVDAERQAERSAQAVERAARALATATTDEEGATETVRQAAETLREKIRAWAGSSRIARCPDGTVEDWCDAVAELTVIDPETGLVVPSRSVTESMRTHAAATRDELARRKEEARLARAPIAVRHDQVAAELDEVRSRKENPPPGPLLWHRRERPAPDEEQGAPLWRCVNPVIGIDADQLALVEAALAAAGLLDAWLSPTGELVTEDGRLAADVQPLPATAGGVATRSLVAILEPVSAGGVPEHVVRRVLGRIAWLDRPPADAADDGDWLTGDGAWRFGGLTGRAEPVGPASYLGAAARAAARQREITRLEAEVAGLSARLTELDAELTRCADDLTTLAGEEATIPVDSERALGAAVVTLAERARRHAVSEQELRDEQERHDDDLAERDTAWARFAEYASTHRFGLRDLETQAEALRTYHTRLARLTAELDVLAARQQALESAMSALAEREQVRGTAAADVSAIESELRQARLRLTTARNALGTDHRERLHRRQELDDDVKRLATQIESLETTLSDARITAARAEEVLKGHEERRAHAEKERDEAIRALWAAVDAGLAQPAGMTVPERRTVQAARELTTSARREITVSAQPADEDRVWRRCFTELQDLRQTLLPNRDARILDEDSDGEAIQQVVVLADPASGWQPPQQAADGLAARAREQQDSYDAEQQRVLATLLGSTFIEHLKDRLDYTTHTFARINDQLARHPTRQGHAVRVSWQADPSDPDASAVVTALGRGYSQLSTERQDMVRSFLARQIDEARGEAADGSADWKDQLAQALDYRRWLRLSLEYRAGPGSGWSVFDAAKHAAKSGGEKVVLLSQPLFAAAVVAYDAAAPSAPRWVWLDEAMTGVDGTIKASFMGLTVDFELDIMLTAHDEWCNYATVPAVAVYDLARERHLPGVDAQPYLWCGGELTTVGVDRLGIRRGVDALPADGLFGVPDDDDG